MTIWRPNEHIEEDVSTLTGIDPQSRRRRLRRAWRDRLADQAVVRHLENVRSYRAFERALIGSVDPQSVLELALVHRLASLLWRLRRATAIETGLFALQSELLSANQLAASRGPGQPTTLQTSAQTNGHKIAPAPNGRHYPPAGDQGPMSMSIGPRVAAWPKSRALATVVLHFSRIDPTLLDRVGRYEARLWRQASQTIWTLQVMRSPSPALTRRSFRKPTMRYWDAEHSVG